MASPGASTRPPRHNRNHRIRRQLLALKLMIDTKGCDEFLKDWQVRFVRSMLRRLESPLPQVSKFVTIEQESTLQDIRERVAANYDLRDYTAPK